MTREEFEGLVQEAYEALPPQFLSAIDNVRVIVEDIPDKELVAHLHLRSPKDLLGLYQGVPLTKRGIGYGMLPSVPDTITLYQKNIEAHCTTGEQTILKLREVLIHEIAHYFGMNEDQVRAAGY